VPGRGAVAPPAPDVHAHPGAIARAGAADDWLQPIMLRAVLSHARDAYLSGDMDYTQSVLDDYAPAVDARLHTIDPATAATEYNALVQLRLEMADISLRLRSNLDYFGHPAGWVPQLSFAATLRSYRDEVKRDIPILYLAYYVQESSTDRLRHIASLQESASRLQADVREASDNFNQAQADIPGLEQQSAILQNKIQLSQQAIVGRKNELMARAEQIIADRNNVPFWKQALGVLSSVASVCPVGQPVVGSIGKGLGIVARADSQGIVETAQEFGNLASDFSKDKIKESVDQYHAQVALLDPSKATNAPTYVKGLVPLAQGLAKGYSAVSASLQARKASSDEVQKEVAQLEANDPNLADLSESVRTLDADKQAFDDKLTDALGRASTLSSTILSDWRTIDATNRAVSSATGAFDHEAVQAIAEFGRRTRDRLLLFQYYLAKAYEYRFLQPYPGSFKLDRLLDALVAMTAAPHDSGFHPISAEQFEMLSKIYDESVQEVINAGLSYAQTHPRPLQASYPYTLAPAQLAALNSDGTIDLNLGQVIPHFLGQENRRLVKIAVVAATAAQPTDGSTPQAIRIGFDHDGTTTLRSNKQSFRFNHRRASGDQPFEWAGTLDGSTWTQDKISREYIATLKQLLSLEDSPDYNELFAYPGLESVISVTREGGEAQPLTSLKLTIDFDYDKQLETEYPLDVVAPDQLQPLIAVDASDNSGRTLGQGSFTRFYPKDTSVTLIAPAQFGTRRFVAWRVAGARMTTSQVTVSMTKGIRAEMEYSR